MKKKTVFKILGLILPVLILVFAFFLSQKNNLPNITPTQLSQYNGSDLNKPVYIAYEGNVYDVSKGRGEFYNDGMPYHYLAGKDSTTELNIAGGAIIKSKYKIVARLTP